MFEAIHMVVVTSSMVLVPSLEECRTKIIHKYSSVSIWHQKEIQKQAKLKLLIVLDEAVKLKDWMKTWVPKTLN